MAARFNLKDYVNGWNKIREVKFHLITSQDNFLVGIAIRYPSMPYGDFLCLHNWESFVESIEATSDGLMIVSSDRPMAKKGAINISVISAQPYYDNRTIANTLKWIGEIIKSVERHPSS